MTDKEILLRAKAEHTERLAAAGEVEPWCDYAPPLDFPPGLKFTRMGDELVLASDNGRPVFTPRGGKRVHQAGVGGQPLFQPVAAPLVARLGGDWTAITAGAGRRRDEPGASLHRHTCYRCQPHSKHRRGRAG